MGMVVGDDFSMGAVAETLNAGLDMVMTWPRNLSKTHKARFKTAGFPGNGSSKPRNRFLRKKFGMG
jgi:hypothetical protein